MKHRTCNRLLLIKGDDIMITYEQLLMEADSHKLITREKALPVSKGRIKGKRIAINRNMTETEKKCVMAEELGHYYTAAGDILDQSSVFSRNSVAVYMPIISLSALRG